MSNPIIAAIDPGHEDAAPAVLGATLAGLTGAPLMLAATYPVDVSVDNLYPAYARTLGRDASADDPHPPRLIGAAFIDTPDGYAALEAACELAAAAHALVRKASCPVLVVPLERRLHAAGAPPSNRPAVA